MRERVHPLAGTLSVAALLVVAAVLLGAVGIVVADTGVVVETTMDDSNVAVNDPVEFDVVVENTDEVGAYAAAIELSDSDTAEIVDVDVAGDPLFEPGAPIADDGSAATLDVVYGDDELTATDDGVVVATVTVEATEEGSVSIETVVDAVGDGDGANYDIETPSDTFTLTAAESPTATFTVDPADPDPGEELTFDASESSTIEEEIIEYRWDFTGDGTVDSTTDDPVITHTYSDPGEYEVTLEVEDSAGETAASNQTLDVFEAEPFFAVAIDETNAPVLEGETLTVTATATNGGSETTQTVVLEDFDGATVDSESVTLSEDESETIELTMETEEDDAAFGDITVRSEDDEATEAVAIQQEATISGCTVIDTPGVYTLAAGASSSTTCIDITESYVEFDGNGISLLGSSVDSGQNAIEIDGTDGELRNVTVRNVAIDGWKGSDISNSAVYAENVTDSEITDVTVTDSYAGIWGLDVTNTEIHGNDISGEITWYGVYLYESDANTVANNHVSGAYWALWLDGDSSENVVADNDAPSNRYALIFQEASNNELADTTSRHNIGDTATDLADFTASLGASDITARNVTVSAVSEVAAESYDADDMDDETVYVTDTGENALGLDIETTAHPDIELSFEASSTEFEATGQPAANPDAESLGQYVAVNPSSGGVIDLAVHYDDEELANVDESSLSLWFYDDGWTELDDATIDTDDQRLEVELTDAGTVGVFVDDPDSDVSLPVSEDVDSVYVEAWGTESNDKEGRFEATLDDSGLWTVDVAVDELSAGSEYDLWVKVENEHREYFAHQLDRTLTVTEEPSAALDIADFEDQLPEPDGETEFGTVDVEVEEFADVETENLEVTLEISDDDGVVFEETVDDRSLRDESAVFSFEVDTLDVGNPYVATVRADADNADGTQSSVQVRGPGPIEVSGCTWITEPGEYALTQDLTAENTCISILADDVVFDGQGHNITGGEDPESFDSALRISGGTNVTVENVRTNDWGTTSYGIRVENGAADVTVRDVETDGNMFGLAMRNVDGYTVENVHIAENRRAGLQLVDAGDGTVRDTRVVENALSDGWRGIDLRGAETSDVLLENVTAERSRNGASGIHVTSSTGSNVTIANSTVVDNNATGLLIDSGGVEVVDTDVRDNAWAIGVDAGVSATTEGLTLGEPADDGLVLSFEARNVQIASTTSPAENADAVSLGRYFVAEPVDGDAERFLDADIHYDQANVSGLDEETLALWTHNGTAWMEVDNSTVDTEFQTLGANLTEFSTVGVFGEEADDEDAFSPGDGAGFGGLAAVVALFAATLLAMRRPE